MVSICTALAHQEAEIGDYIDFAKWSDSRFVPRREFCLYFNCVIFSMIENSVVTIFRHGFFVLLNTFLEGNYWVRAGMSL